MNIKVKYNFWLPKLFGRNALVLYPYILISKSETETRKTKLLHHEWIHILQMRKEGFFIFYLRYLGEWVINLFTDYQNAYQNISYEKEASIQEKKLKLPRKLIQKQKIKK